MLNLRFNLVGELIEACKKIIGSYEKKAAPGETPDAYADVFLPLYNVVHPYDIILVKQVFLLLLIASIMFCMPLEYIYFTFRMKNY